MGYVGRSQGCAWTFNKEWRHSFNQFIFYVAWSDLRQQKQIYKINAVSRNIFTFLELLNWSFRHWWTAWPTRHLFDTTLIQFHETFWRLQNDFFSRQIRSLCCTFPSFLQFLSQIFSSGLECCAHVVKLKVLKKPSVPTSKFLGFVSAHWIYL